ncbi:hypothetical protein D3C80_1315220 [compost metagenome]
MKPSNALVNAWLNFVISGCWCTASARSSDFGWAYGVPSKVNKAARRLGKAFQKPDSASSSLSGMPPNIEAYRSQLSGGSDESTYRGILRL